MLSIHLPTAFVQHGNTSGILRNTYNKFGVENRRINRSLLFRNFLYRTNSVHILSDFDVISRNTIRDRERSDTFLNTVRQTIIGNLQGVQCQAIRLTHDPTPLGITPNRSFITVYRIERIFNRTGSFTHHQRFTVYRHRRHNRMNDRRHNHIRSMIRSCGEISAHVSPLSIFQHISRVTVIPEIGHSERHIYTVVLLGNTVHYNEKLVVDHRQVKFKFRSGQ